MPRSSRADDDGRAHGSAIGRHAAFFEALDGGALEDRDAEAFDDNQLAFAVKLTAASAGDYSIPGTLKFAVCTESTCNPKKHAIALALKAQ